MYQPSVIICPHVLRSAPILQKTFLISFQKMTIYNKLKLEFISSHQNHSNVLVHLFTTFGFYISMISLMNTGISAAVQQNIFKAILKSLLQGLQAALDIFIVICESVIKERLPLCNCFLSKVEPFNENHVSFYINAFLWIIYSLSIISLVSFRISVISTCLIVIAFCISNMSNLSLVSSSLLFVASYVLQVQKLKHIFILFLGFCSFYGV